MANEAIPRLLQRTGAVLRGIRKRAPFFDSIDSIGRNHAIVEQPFPATESNQCAPLAPFESGASMSHLKEQDAISMASNSGGL